MSRQIAVIVVIFVCTTVAWSILGTTIFDRTYSSDESLKNRVASIWGAPHVQKPPTATSTKEVVRKVEASENGKTVIRTEKDYVLKPLALDASKLTVGLDLEHRQKGLLVQHVQSSVRRSLPAQEHDGRRNGRRSCQPTNSTSELRRSRLHRRWRRGSLRQ